MTTGYAPNALNFFVLEEIVKTSDRIYQQANIAHSEALKYAEMYASAQCSIEEDLEYDNRLLEKYKMWNKVARELRAQAADQARIERLRDRKENLDKKDKANKAVPEILNRIYKPPQSWTSSANLFIDPSFKFTISTAPLEPSLEEEWVESSV